MHQELSEECRSARLARELYFRAGARSRAGFPLGSLCSFEGDRVVQHVLRIPRDGIVIKCVYMSLTLEADFCPIYISADPTCPLTIQ